MIKWFCRNCGKTTYKKTIPSYNDEGQCSMVITEMRMNLTSLSNKKLPKNHRVHQWVNQDELINELGYLPDYQYYQRQYQEKLESEQRINNHVRENYGNDLILDNGKLNENYNHSEKEKTFKEDIDDLKNEFKEIKESVSGVFKSFKNLFKK